MKKRIVSLLLAMLMLVTLLPVQVWAEELIPDQPAGEQVVSGGTTDPVEEPEQPTAPENPEQPEQPGNPEEPETPEEPESPEEPEEPVETETPEVLEQEPRTETVWTTGTSDPCDSFEWKRVKPKAHNVPFMYNDGMLFDNARALSTDLAKASIIVADVAYQGVDSTSTSEKQQITVLLESMGYTCLDNSESYGRTTDIYNNDTVAFTIGFKEVTYQGEEYRLYCVPVRGTPGSAEWYSNFNIGTTGNHEGFYKAASEVYDKLNAEMQNDTFDADHTMVWITGHSRGAAVANVVAGRLTDESNACRPEHTFAYTYACPSVSRNLRSDAESYYNNIYNFNNPGDPITAVPLKSWGYKRYGVTVDLSLDHLDNLRQRYRTYVKEEYGAELSTDNYVKTFEAFFQSEESVQWPVRKFALLLGATALSGEKLSADNLIKCAGITLESSSLTSYIQEGASWMGLINRLSDMSKKDEGIFAFCDSHRQEVAAMTETEFTEFCNEYKSEIDLLEEATSIIVNSQEAFSDAYDEMIHRNADCNTLQSAVREAQSLWGNAESEAEDLSTALSNVSVAVKHGHQQSTYILWINSMYGGYEGWSGNGSVTDIDIPQTRTISENAFYNCASLTNITMPNTVQVIGARAFCGCSSLTSITIPDTVEKIGSQAFYGCSGLLEVTMPISANYVISDEHYSNYQSFNGCGRVQKITYTVGNGSVFAPGFTNSLPYFAKDALLAVEFEEGITEIPAGVLGSSYSGCSKVTSVKLPSTVKTIGALAFSGCASLSTGLDLPNVESIGDYAFLGCKLVPEINISDNVKELGAAAFSGCSSLKEMHIPKLTEIRDFTFLGCSSLTSITIPDTVEKIGSQAFYGCSGLLEVTMPISANYVISDEHYSNYQSFNGCGRVQKITYTVGNGSVFAPGFTNSLPYFAKDALLAVEFEEGITEIPAGVLGSSYSGCSQLTSVKLPSTVGTIGASAFLGCAGLTDVYYMAREAQWKAVTINTGNERLTAARIHFIMDGDVNGSCGAPDAGDMQCLYTYLTSGEIVGAYRNNADMFIDLADVNRDGTVDVYDLQRLYEAISGINAFADVSAQ